MSDFDADLFSSDEEESSSSDEESYDEESSSSDEYGDEESSSFNPADENCPLTFHWQPKLAKKLFREGTLNKQEIPGLSDTRLHDAVTRGNQFLIKLYLIYGADPTIKSGPLQYTPVHYSANYGAGQYVDGELSIHFFAKHVNIKAKDGITPLMVAAKFGHHREIHELIKYGAKINEKNDKGQNALYLAAMHHNLKGVKELLKYNVDTMCLNIKDKNGMTALDYAQSNSKPWDVFCDTDNWYYIKKQTKYWDVNGQQIIELLNNAIRKKEANKEIFEILQEKISENGIIKNIMAMKYELEKEN